MTTVKTRLVALISLRPGPVSARFWCASAATLLLTFVCLAQAADEEQQTPGRIPLEDLKKAIIDKNIFRPARVPSSPIVTPAAEPEPGDPIDRAPRKLKRPFTVLGFVTKDDTDFVHLHFENPSGDRTVKAGYITEFVRVVEVTPPYIRCEYDGREVRIDAGETSDDAFTRLMGLGSEYFLITTTMTPTGKAARFYFPREDRQRTVEEGDLLGNAVIIRIDHGRVYLRHEDGYEFSIKTSTVPRP